MKEQIAYISRRYKSEETDNQPESFKELGSNLGIKWAEQNRWIENQLLYVSPNCVMMNIYRAKLVIFKVLEMLYLGTYFRL